MSRKALVFSPASPEQEISINALIPHGGGLGRREREMGGRRTILFTTSRNFFTAGAFYEGDVQTDLAVPVIFLPRAHYFCLEMVSLIKCSGNACDQQYQNH